MPRALFPTLFCGETCDTLELQELQKLATQVHFSAGRTIFSEGELADHVFGLSQGVVRHYKLLPDGRRQITGFSHQGDFLGVPATGRPVKVWGMVIDRLQDGRIKDTRILMDSLGLMMQLGVLPPP